MHRVLVSAQHQAAAPVMAVVANASTANAMTTTKNLHGFLLSSQFVNSQIASDNF
jgi:hypothetical protein